MYIRTYYYMHSTTDMAALLFFFLISSFSLLSLVSTQHLYVLDSDGRPLQPNSKYYILPAGGGGGGLALSIRDRRDPCPPNVMQEPHQDSVGLSLELFPADAAQPQRAISLSADLNIAFMAATTCVQRTVWQVGRVDAATGRRYVRTDGVVGRPGKGTAGNWFKVEEHGGGYKIVYCPSVCGGGRCGVECGDLGVVEESGRRWVGVGLGGGPLNFVFKKVIV